MQRRSRQSLEMDFKKEGDLKSVKDIQDLVDQPPIEKKSKHKIKKPKVSGLEAQSLTEYNLSQKEQLPGEASEEDEEQYQNKLIESEIKKEEKRKEVNKKMFVGSGFSFDITQFFKFKKKKEIEGKGDNLFESISGGHLSWLILIYSVCNAAVIPPWIMSIKANKILRISWRFLLQALVMIPFVLYQKRSGSDSVKEKYRREHIFSLEGLKKIYVSSIGTTIWFTIILSCFEWTYISHSLVLGSLSNFFLSLNRSWRNASHELEPGGQLFVVAGILFVLTDSYTFSIEEAPSRVWNVINTYYLTRESIHRVIADLCALSGAFISSRFSQMAADLKSYYPPFLSMFLVNLSISFHMALSGFYFNGATFDLDTNFGIFGLFTQMHFASFFYMSVILSFGMFISFTLITKLFSDPIIPALAMTLQPIFATFFLNVAGVQTMPGSFSIFGYILLVCGLFLILIGQCTFQRRKEKQEKQKQIDEDFKKKLLQKYDTIPENLEEDSSSRNRSPSFKKVRIQQMHSK